MVRDQSARVIVDGIHGTDGSFESLDLPLFNARSFDVESEAQTNRETVPGEEDGDSLLAPISGSRSVRLSGQTSVSAVSTVYPSLGRIESLRTWLRSLEALVLPQQGLGWQIQDSVRGKTYDPTSNRGVLFDDVSWSYSPSDGERFDYTVSGQFSEGVQNRDSPSEYISNTGVEDIQTDKLVIEPASQSPLEIDFSHVENRNLSRTTRINSTDLIFQQEEQTGDSPVLGTINEGVTTDLTIDGTIYEPTSFAGTVQEFDRELQGEIAEFQDEFSGKVWIGTISNSSTSIENGRPNRFDFDATLEIGQVLS